MFGIIYIGGDYMKKPIAIDLFCGAGGMSEGMLQAGFHIIYSNDISKDAMKTYIHRHEQLGLYHKKNTFESCKDIRELDAKEIFASIAEIDEYKNKTNITIDAIFGGPPCQGFSRAGKRNAEDPRNKLFKEYIRVINDVRPKYVVMENVEGFLDTVFEGFIGLDGEQYKKGKAPSILINEFKKIGYNTIGPKLLNASDYGVPQNRKRMIFIAFLPSCAEPKFPSPLKAKKVTLKDAIYDLINIDKVSSFAEECKYGRTKRIDGNNVDYDNSKVLNNEMSSHTKLISERFSLYNEGETTFDLRKRIQTSGIDLTEKNAIIQDLLKKYSTDEKGIIKMFKEKKLTDEDINNLLTKKGIRKKLKYSIPSPTMVTLPDDFIHPTENRTLTVREMARIQSFDDSFEFLGKRTTGGPRRKLEVPQYTQVGNAVPPLLAKAIANEILKALNGKK